MSKDYFLKTIKIKDELENEIITVQFEKPNITVKSFLNHLDLKLSPLKHWTLKKNHYENSDYVLLNTNKKAIWISQDMINEKLTIIQLLEIYNYDIKNEEFIIYIYNKAKIHILNDQFYNLLDTNIHIILQNVLIENDSSNYSHYISIFNENANKHLLFYYLSIMQRIGRLNELKFDLNKVELIIDAIKRNLLVLDINSTLQYVLDLTDHEKKYYIFLLALKNHPLLFEKIKDKSFVDNDFFLTAIKYFPHNIQYLTNTKLDMINLEYFIKKYDCPIIMHLQNFIYTDEQKKNKLIILSLSKNYANIKYIDYPNEYLPYFLQSFTKTEGYNFKLINLLDSTLFKNKFFIELCLDSNLGKYIINFIKLDKIKDIDLILKFIRNNCYKDIRVKIELTDDQKENLYLALIKEGFIDEALEIKKKKIKDLTDKDIDLIIAIINTKQINKIREIPIIKEMNLNFDYNETTVVKILIEIIENGLLIDLIKLDIINNTDFIKFLEYNNLIDKVDKLILRRIIKQIKEK
jgi:hypothetical protein